MIASLIFQYYEKARQESLLTGLRLELLVEFTVQNSHTFLVLLIHCLLKFQTLDYFIRFYF